MPTFHTVACVHSPAYAPFNTHVSVLVYLPANIHADIAGYAYVLFFPVSLLCSLCLCLCLVCDTVCDHACALACATASAVLVP